MAYQFFHIETYSERPKRVKGSKDHYNSAGQVLEEARRTARHSTHVATPLPPAQLPGTMPIDALIARRRELLAGVVETVTAKGGATYTRRLREDAATLYTEIHSHPIRSADYVADPGAHEAEVGRWLRHLTRDFRQRMPEGIAFTAVMHLDESHLHVHILAVHAADPKLDANKLHAGKRAGAEYRETCGSDAIASLPEPDLLARPKKPKKPRPSKNRATQKKNDASHAEEIAAWEAECALIDAENARRLEVWEAENAAHIKAVRDARGTNGATKAYNAAMRKLQDDYHEAVGKPCGLLRIGPRLTRKSTKEHAAEKRQAKAVAEELERLDHQRREQEANAVAFAAHEAGLAATKEALANREAAHEAEVTAMAKAFDEERAALSRAEAEARKAHAARTKAHEEKEKELRHREAELTGAVEAMDQILDAVESGEAEVTNGKLHMPKWPNFLRRMAEPMIEGTSPSPVMNVVRRFLKLIVRTQIGLGGSRSAMDSRRNDDRPGW